MINVNLKKVKLMNYSGKSMDIKVVNGKFNMYDYNWTITLTGEDQFGLYGEVSCSEGIDFGLYSENRSAEEMVRMAVVRIANEV